MLDLKQVEAVFTIIWPQQDWNGGDEGFCRAVAEKVVRTLQAVGPEPVAVRELHGPYGWLNGHRALSEDSWELENDPLENSDEYFAIPLYALTDPFAEIGKDGPRSALVATPPAGGDDWTVDDTLTAREILDYLGIGSDASLEPYADRRRDAVAKIIQKRIATTPPAERVVEVAAQYAERLANVLWEKHYRNAAPDWKPLTGDLIGIITQIDNMTSGLALAAKPAAKDDETVVEAARAVLADWDARLPDGPEVHRTNHDLDFSYWSPNAAMISAEVMSKLRAALAAKDGRFEPLPAAPQQGGE